jgi:nicotinamide riboside kinase
MLGCPSSGKTSLSAKLFAQLKAMDLNAEYTSEYVKGWAWEGKKVGPFDQFYIFGKETHNQSRLFDKVDFIISDSPVMLTAFYHYFYNGNEALNEVCHNFYNLAEEAGVEVVNFFLPRKKKYVAKGRYQTQEEADALAFQLKEWLNKEGYEYTTLECPDKERINVVLEKLKEMTGDFDGMSVV